MDHYQLPREISFPITRQSWRVRYVKNNAKELELIEGPYRQLVLHGPTDQKKVCKKILSAWVRKQAKKYLIAKLNQLSIKTQLKYKKVTIRGQKKRWGSCSNTKTINLNYKLLFIPAPLVKHLLIHELCHIAQLNHSAKFWRLVARFDKRWKRYNEEIMTADKWVPAWCD